MRPSDLTAQWLSPSGPPGSFSESVPQCRLRSSLPRLIELIRWALRLSMCPPPQMITMELPGKCALTSWCSAYPTKSPRFLFVPLCVSFLFPSSSRSPCWVLLVRVEVGLGCGLNLFANGMERRANRPSADKTSANQNNNNNNNNNKNQQETLSPPLLFLFISFFSLSLSFSSARMEEAVKWTNRCSIVQLPLSEVIYGMDDYCSRSRIPLFLFSLFLSLSLSLEIRRHSSAFLNNSSVMFQILLSSGFSSGSGKEGEMEAASRFSRILGDFFPGDSQMIFFSPLPFLRFKDSSGQSSPFGCRQDSLKIEACRDCVGDSPGIVGGETVAFVFVARGQDCFMGAHSYSGCF